MQRQTSGCFLRLLIPMLLVLARIQQAGSDSHLLDFLSKAPSKGRGMQPQLPNAAILQIATGHWLLDHHQNLIRYRFFGTPSW